LRLQSRIFIRNTNPNVQGGDPGFDLLDRRSFLGEKLEAITRLNHEMLEPAESAAM